MLKTYLSENLNKLLNPINNIPGDIVELGVFKGNTIIALQDILKNSNKKYHGFDTFSGYTKEDLEEYPEKNNVKALQHNQNSNRWNINSSIVFDVIKKYNLTDKCNLYIGDLKKEFKEAIDNNLIKQISVLLVDCNAFLPSYIGMTLAYKILNKGGIIAIDEHNPIGGGETQALKKFSLEQNLLIKSTGFSYPNGPSNYLIKES